MTKESPSPQSTFGKSRAQDSKNKNTFPKMQEGKKSKKLRAFVTLVTADFATRIIS